MMIFLATGKMDFAAAEREHTSAEKVLWLVPGERMFV